ncbi:class A beta-lactamase [Rhodococcus sp. EPR-157]|uniref:class A beta-lactamase n=1 Tax=Rhodococcus sp. EPR-157 TaxID=1813677 RepID=UPI0022B22B01|nr:class A beta-lactamase [Rhodococcus sp. EPR-157]
MLTACAEPQSAPPQPSGPTPASSAARTHQPASADVSTVIRNLEQRFDARVGVSAFDTETGATMSYRGSERFGFASTLKAFAAAEFLRQTSTEDRDELVRWTRSDIDRAGYSPVTTENLDTGLTAAELAEAAVRESDNTALNLVLDRIGGPEGLDDALELLGDATTEVVNYEPELNTITSGSIDDTTTADAFTESMTALQQTSYSTSSNRSILLDWMSGNKTGDPLVRAGAPAGWVVADKSGGAGPIRNDIAVVTPPERSAVVITILTEKNDPAAQFDNELVSETAAVVLHAIEVGASGGQPDR